MIAPPGSLFSGALFNFCLVCTFVTTKKKSKETLLAFTGFYSVGLHVASHMKTSGPEVDTMALSVRHCVLILKVFVENN